MERQRSQAITYIYIQGNKQRNPTNCQVGASPVGEVEGWERKYIKVGEATQKGFWVFLFFDFFFSLLFCLLSTFMAELSTRSTTKVCSLCFTTFINKFPLLFLSFLSQNILPVFPINLDFITLQIMFTMYEHFI